MRPAGGVHLNVPRLCVQQTRVCPEGVGARLAGDLARSGSDSCNCAVPGTTKTSGFAAGPRQIAGKPGSHGLRPESKASDACSVAVRLAGGGDFKDATAAKQDCYRATIRLDYNVEFFANCSFKNAFMSAHELMSAALL